MKTMGVLISKPRWVHSVFSTKWNLLLAMAVVWGMALVWSLPCAAQDVDFVAQKPPYYAGEPLLVQVVVSDLKETDEVECVLENAPSNGVTIDGPRVSQSSQSMTQIMNGRVSRHESVSYRFTFSITVDQTGEYDVGPFVVTINGQSQTVSGRTFRFTELEADPAMSIEYSLPQDSFYVGQRIPLTIRWTYRGNVEQVQHAFSKLQIRSPLFNQFRFSDERLQTHATLVLSTVDGVVEVDGLVAIELIDGEEAIVVTGQRMLLAELPGEFTDVPITCRTRRVTRWGRNVFGERVASEDTLAFAAGQPLTFTVQPIPLLNRPTSFSGGVGKGFSMSVAANRSVVRVGEPISLTISIRGQGNLDSISLPSLENNLGLSKSDFVVPNEPVPGEVHGHEKQFKINLRVKHTGVTQIPAIDFSWFDPSREEFVTASSKPIALQVMDTTIVSSQDVVSNEPRRSQQDPAATQATNPSPSLAGANLAIETETSRLLANVGTSTMESVAPATIYGLALVIGWFVWVRGKRDDQDEHERRQRIQLRNMKKTLERARSQDPQQALQQVAETLRIFVKDFEPDDRASVDSLIAKCDDWIFSPTKADSTVVGSVVDQSLKVMDMELKS